MQIKWGVPHRQPTMQQYSQLSHYHPLHLYYSAPLFGCCRDRHRPRPRPRPRLPNAAAIKPRLSSSSSIASSSSSSSSSPNLIPSLLLFDRWLRSRWRNLPAPPRAWPVGAPRMPVASSGTPFGPPSPRPRSDPTPLCRSGRRIGFRRRSGSDRPWAGSPSMRRPRPGSSAARRSTGGGGATWWTMVVTRAGARPSGPCRCRARWLPWRWDVYQLLLDRVIGISEEVIASFFSSYLFDPGRCSIFFAI